MRDHLPTGTTRPDAEDRLLDAVLTAAAAPAERGPQPGEETALVAFRALNPNAGNRRKRMLPRSTPAKIATAGLVAGLVLGGGVAAADTGLPTAASDAAKAALNRLGIEVGGPEDDTASDRPGDKGERKGAKAPGASRGKGADVSELARTTSETGADKGATISEVASDGKSRAGERGASGDGPANDARGSGHSSVPAPNDGGTDTAGTASGGTSTEGTGTASDASGGRAGSTDIGHEVPSHP